MSDDFTRRADRALSALERELVAAYGWTLLDVELTPAPERLALLVRGRVAAPRVIQRLAAALADALPETWRVDVTGVTLLASQAWHGLPAERGLLWRKLPARDRTLATELLAEDGPVSRLAEHAGSSLVRAMDGTQGWLEGPLGPAAATPSIRPAHGTSDEVIASAHGLLGTPYRLGGTSHEGIDCSGLVQRAYRRGFGVLLPRHSTDQLQATLHVHSAPRRNGDLVFVWSEREGPCHVGILVADEAPCIVHASLSRKCVVKDPMERFVESASRIEIVPIVSVLDYHEQNVGRSALELPLAEGPAA